MVDYCIKSKTTYNITAFIVQSSLNALELYIRAIIYPLAKKPLHVNLGDVHNVATGSGGHKVMLLAWTTVHLTMILCCITFQGGFF